MSRIFFILLMLITLTLSAYAQKEEPLVYQIKAVYQKSDFNQKAIERYQKREVEWNDTGEVLKLFKPVKGKYKVILFMATGYGLLHERDKGIFHNILILKVDKNDEILDGMEYVLEWAEVPTAARLLRATKTGVKLKKGLPISQLDFKTFETGFKDGFGFWNHEGIIDNLYNFEEIFDVSNFMMGND